MKKIDSFLPNNFIKTLLVLIIFFIFFKSSIENFITTITNNSFLCNIEKNFITDIIFIFSVIYICINTIINFYNNFVLSDKLLIVKLLIVLLYLHYRFNNNLVCFFKKLIFIDTFYYSDIIIFIFLSDLIILIFKNISNRKTVKDSFFIDDKPLDLITIEEDIYKRKFSSNNLAKSILNSHSDYSFAIAIEGKWGIGKTTYLNNIKNHLIKEEEDLIILNFNVWNCKNHEDIIHDFFNLLADKLKKYNKEIKRFINNYIKELISHNDDYKLNSLLNTFLKLFEYDTSKYENYIKINLLLKKINKKIIIFIDDLDRLDKEEVLNVLKLIRNTANFHNTFYIVAFDKYYIQESLKEHQLNEKNYLDKIFQLEIVLPDFDDYTLTILFFNLLMERFPDNSNDISSFMNENDNTINGIYTDGLLKTKREIIRFINIFSFEYENVKFDIDFICFLFISLVKFKNVELFNNLRDNISKSNFDDFKNVDILGFNTSFENDIHKIYEDFFDKNDISNNHLNIGLKSLTNYIFNIDKFNSINKHHYFNIYFYNHLFDNKISDFEFNTIYLKDLNHILFDLKYYVENYPHEYIINKFINNIKISNNNDHQILWLGYIKLYENFIYTNMKLYYFDKVLTKSKDFIDKQNSQKLEILNLKNLFKDKINSDNIIILFIENISYRSDKLFNNFEIIDIIDNFQYKSFFKGYKFDEVYKSNIYYLLYKTCKNINYIPKMYEINDYIKNEFNNLNIENIFENLFYNLNGLRRFNIFLSNVFNNKDKELKNIITEKVQEIQDIEIRNSYLSILNETKLN